MIVNIFGASGFIGKNLLRVLPDAVGISMRDSCWKENTPEAQIYINLVGKAHDHKKKASERDYYYANVDCLKEIYAQFIHSSANLLIHISSIAAVEETFSSKPLLEDASCTPSSWYGKSKRAAELWLLAQPIPDEKKVVILRPPMVHGPGDKGNLGLLYGLISKGIPYPLSNFENKRSFISIDNFCYLIQQIIEKRNLISSGIYHMADDKPVSTTEIIRIIKNVRNTKGLTVAVPKGLVKFIAKLGDYIPLPLNSIRLNKMTSDLVVSNNKIKKSLQLGDLPQSALEGLEKTIRSFN